MAAALERRTPQRKRAMGRRPGFSILPREQRPIGRFQPAIRPQPRYRRIGKIQRASNENYNFTIRTLRETNTGEKQYLIGRTHRMGEKMGKTDWRMMSVIEYRRSQNVARKNGKGEGKVQLLTTSATMLAKNPEVFTHIGHQITESVLHLLAMAA